MNVEQQITPVQPTPSRAEQRTRTAAVAGIDVWALYEQRKAELSPLLDEREYTAACRRILNELGA